MPAFLHPSHRNCRWPGAPMFEGLTAAALADALRAEALPNKALARLAGATPRAVENWRAEACLPRADQLIRLMHHCRHVATCVLEAAGLSDAALAADLAALDAQLAALRARLEVMRGEQHAVDRGAVLQRAGGAAARHGRGLSDTGRDLRGVGASSAARRPPAGVM